MDKRWTACLAASAACLVASVALRAGGPQQPPASVPSVTASPLRATLDRYCVTCHNDRVKAGGLVLAGLDVARPAPDAATWEKVVRKLRGRMMPPAGVPRPDEATYNALVSDLESSLDATAALHPNPGRTDTFRRLSRVEYQNAIRDILDLEVDVSALLPKDDASHGFDNVANGALSPTLLERYLAAAQKVSRAAVGGPLPSPASHVVILPSDLTQEDHLDGLPLGTRGGTAVRYNFPRDGSYEIQIRLSRDRNENVEGLTEPQQVELTLDGQRVQVFGVKPNRNQSGAYYADEAVDKDLHTRIHVSAGPHDNRRRLSQKDVRARGDGAAAEPRALQHGPASARADRALLGLDRRPLRRRHVAGSVTDTPSRRRLFVCRPASAAAEDGCARQIVSRVARRAFRRAVTAADIDAPMQFYKQARTDGGFDAGIEMALRAVLASTEFLFRVERDPRGVAPQTPYRVSDVELATRLSFFLWSSVPDDALLELAIAGRLNRPATLEQQVKRMLASPKAEALVTNFAGQWLYLRNLAAVSPDARTFPDFDDNLRQAFRRETELFVDSIVREDRSALDLLRANYTFVNERLARHYGIPNVYGSRFRRVPLGNDSVRGGLLGQGSVLTVTSYANRTSPVLRGKWILENILGTPPPPPPPNVPTLKDTDVEGRVLSMRERMAQHRASPACAGCHQLMDPAGLAMENFDAIGRWRLRTESGGAVDASGGLPDGSAFNGMSGLRAALLRKPEMFVGTLTEKLLTYGLGRGVEYYDAPSVRAIVSGARAQEYRFSSLVLGIVSSDPFQMRMSR